MVQKCKKYCKKELKTRKIKILRSLVTFGKKSEQKMFNKSFLRSCVKSCNKTLKRRKSKSRK